MEQNAKVTKTRSAHPLAIMEMSADDARINWEHYKKVREARAKLGITNGARKN